MDTQTIDQEYEKLQGEFADVAKTVKTLADKLQAAANGGDANAKEWLDDLEVVAKDIDEEQTQAKVLLLVIHRFIAAAAQSQPAQDPGNVESTDNHPLYAPGHEPQQQPQQAPQQGYGGRGMFGGGMMMGGPFGGYMGGGFAQAMEMGAGMSLGAGLIGSLFRR
jgi:hypothetical protein